VRRHLRLSCEPDGRRCPHKARPSSASRPRRCATRPLTAPRRRLPPPSPPGVKPRSTTSPAGTRARARRARGAGRGGGCATPACRCRAAPESEMTVIIIATPKQAARTHRLQHQPLRRRRETIVTPRTLCRARFFGPAGQLDSEFKFKFPSEFTLPARVGGQVTRMAPG
jgi:hypothetical protein